MTAPLPPMSESRLEQARGWQRTLQREGKPIVAAVMAELLAEVDRLRADPVRQAARQVAAELEAEHQRDAQVDGCVICWPKDGHYPCASAMNAAELRAALAEDEHREDTT